MKKRLLALLLAVSLTAGIGSESVYAAQTEGKTQEAAAIKSRGGEETVVKKNYGAGNTMATATSISLGSKVSGVISETNDKDYYKITVPSSSSIQLNLKFTSYMSRVYLRMYNGEGESILSDDVHWNSNISQTTEDYTVYLNPGTYYIGIIKCGYTGSYTFKSSYTALNNIDLQPDDTIATAHAIPLTTSFTGVLAEDEESDIYKLNVRQRELWSVSLMLI